MKSAQVAIVARERSSVSLNSEEYRFLEESSDFWTLVQSGIVSLERTAKHRYAIRGSAYVGHALINGRRLLIEEKINGALPELLELTAKIDAKLAGVPTFVQEFGRILEQLAARFLDQLDDYLLFGRKKRYIAQHAVAGIPRGKLDLTRTIRMWAVGRLDRIAYTSYDLSPDLLENRLIGLALHSLDRSLSSAQGESKLIARLRTLAVLFDDVGWPHLAGLPLNHIGDLFERALADPEMAPLEGLLKLARMFALYFGIGVSPSVLTIPVAWFVSLESLFEDAVREAIIQSGMKVLPSLTFSDWRSVAKSIFAGEDGYRPNPDVIGRLGDSVVLVMDAKYKDFENKPDRGDLYQLLVHMRAYDAKLGVLIYPSSEYSLQYIGQTDEGEHIFAISLSLPVLRKDAAKLLADLAQTALLRRTLSAHISPGYLA